VKQVEFRTPSCCFLARLLDPKDGGDVFLRNIDELPPTYTALYLRSQTELIIVTAVRTAKPKT
jgi:hypothetical protein